MTISAGETVSALRAAASPLQAIAPLLPPVCGTLRDARGWLEGALAGAQDLTTPRDRARLSAAIRAAVHLLTEVLARRPELEELPAFPSLDRSLDALLDLAATLAPSPTEPGGGAAR